MIGKNNTYKVLEFFFSHPTREIHLRELSRELELSMPALLSALAKLEKEELILISRGRALTVVRANLDNKTFFTLKKINNLERLYLTGFVDFLYSQLNKPQAIICFGSYSRGEDIEKSDIDIAIIGGVEKEVSFKKFEEKLLRPISIHYVKLSKVSEEFRSNLYNGIILEGAI